MTDHAKRIRAARERADKAAVRATEARDAYRAAMRNAHADDWTLQRIGDVLGISRERVRQLLKEEREDARTETR